MEEGRQLRLALVLCERARARLERADERLMAAQGQAEEREAEAAWKAAATTVRLAERAVLRLGGTINEDE